MQEVIKYSIPALFVFLATYLVLIKLINNENKQRKFEALLNNQRIITPIRIQAYERMILFLERISLQSLVLRTQRPKMTNRELQSNLLKAIRTEFEHNVAHQIYVTDKSWEMVKSAKENLVKSINQQALQNKPDGPAIQLSKMMLENILDESKDPTTKAKKYIKSEVAQLF